MVIIYSIKSSSIRKLSRYYSTSTLIHIIIHYLLIICIFTYNGPYYYYYFNFNHPRRYI